MSKSRGTFIKAETYLKHLPPENLRYYYAAKLSARVEDLDLNLDDFRQKNNSDLVGKLVNLASRCAPFLDKHFANQLADALPDTALLDSIAAKANDIADAYERREYSQAMRDIMKLADAANEYIDAEKPWVKAKDEASRAAVQTIATVGLNAYRQLITYLKPVLPQLAEASEAFLNIAPLTWDDAQHPLLGHTINPYQPLMQRIDEKTITAVINDSKEDLKEEASINKGAKPVENENWISIDDFAKPDLRIARVLECSHIDGSDKLLRFKLDVGELGEREVFSGIKAYYQPEDLIGRMVVYVANLAPRKMRFGVSTGMILSATSGGELHLLNPGEGVKAGMKIS
jgi:methionine--tRNA ligase